MRVSCGKVLQVIPFWVNLAQRNFEYGVNHVKMSQAFAAFRTSLITDHQHSIVNELVPEFNSRCEDIRRRSDADFEKYHNQAKADNLKKTLTYDLLLYQQQILENVQKSVADKINERLARDNAQITREEIPDKRRSGQLKEVVTAYFPDESRARVPSGLWIDFQMFDHV